MLILISMDILVMELELKEEEVKMSKLGQNVLIFESDMSFSAHIDNEKKDILVLGIGPTQEHTLTAEKLYSISFTVTKKRFCLSLHCNGANSYLFVNGTEI